MNFEKKQIKLSIEKTVKYTGETRYYLWLNPGTSDVKCLDSFDTEEAAQKAFEIAKRNLQNGEIIIIREELI